MNQRLLRCSVIAHGVLALSLARADLVDDYIKSQMNERRIPALVLAPSSGRVSPPQKAGFHEVVITSEASTLVAIVRKWTTNISKEKDKH